MRDNPLYKEVLKKIRAEKKTLKEVQKLSYDKVCEMAGDKEMTIGFCANLKLKISNLLQAENDEKTMQYLTAQLAEWLSEFHPDYQIERGREQDKPFVKVWLEGKSEEDGDIK